MSSLTQNSIVKKVDTKTWAIVGLGSLAALATTLLVSQWKHVAIGKQVTTNVVRFLIDHGATVNNGVVSGGVMQTPMKINTAVNSTIVQMLNAVADDLAQGRSHTVDTDSSRPPLDEPPSFTGDARPSKKTSSVAKTGATSRTPRRQRKQLAAAGSPLEISKTLCDDGGYRDMQKGSTKSLEYNPNDVIAARGVRQPENKSVFSDDEDVVGPVGDAAEDDDDYQ